MLVIANTTHTIAKNTEKEEIYNSDDISKWLKDNITSDINVTGLYCDKYHINISLNIDACTVNNIFVKNDIAEAIDSLEKELCKITKKIQ